MPRFRVKVKRLSPSYNTFEVEADNIHLAKIAAIQEAENSESSDWDYSESHFTEDVVVETKALRPECPPHKGQKY